MSDVNGLTTDLGERRARFEVDESIYALDTIQGAAYLFLDRCYVFLDRPADRRVAVLLKAKGDADEATLEALAGEFANELLNQALRKAVGKAAAQGDDNDKRGHAWLCFFSAGKARVPGGGQAVLDVLRRVKSLFVELLAHEAAEAGAVAHAAAHATAVALVRATRAVLDAPAGEPVDEKLLDYKAWRDAAVRARERARHVAAVGAGRGRRRRRVGGRRRPQGLRMAELLLRGQRRARARRRAGGARRAVARQVPPRAAARARGWCVWRRRARRRRKARPRRARRARRAGRRARRREAARL